MNQTNKTRSKRHTKKAIYQKIQRVTLVATIVGICLVILCILIVSLANLSFGIGNWLVKILPSAIYLLALLGGLILFTCRINYNPRYQKTEEAFCLIRAIRRSYLVNMVVLIFITVLGAIGTGLQVLDIFDCQDIECVKSMLEKAHLIKTTFSIETATAWFISIEVKVILYYSFHELKKIP